MPPTPHRPHLLEIHERSPPPSPLRPTQSPECEPFAKSRASIRNRSLRPCRHGPLTSAISPPRRDFPLPSPTTRRLFRIVPCHLKSRPESRSRCAWRQSLQSLPVIQTSERCT